MDIPYPIFEDVEDIATCLYSLCEGGFEHVDCVPIAINAILDLASRLRIEIKLPEVLAQSMPPATSLTEYEVHTQVNELRRSIATDPVKTKHTLARIYSSLVNTVALQIPTLELPEPHEEVLTV